MDMPEYLDHVFNQALTICSNTRKYRELSTKTQITKEQIEQLALQGMTLLNILTAGVKAFEVITPAVSESSS